MKVRNGEFEVATRADGTRYAFKNCTPSPASSATPRLRVNHPQGGPTLAAAPQCPPAPARGSRGAAADAEG